ncbi:alpha-(1,3)-fucosyltransferase 10 isoform X1 [Epargyreus clarus]|uniref:alpha-(1,3)-fucosyltransferase 10 isoform X1 n=1 Tax=Epargyreus clarus TaxID=520877 RepID=UPI003C2C9167
MCLIKLSVKFVRLIKFIMRNIFVDIFRRILKLTFYQLICILGCFCFVFVLLMWKSVTDTTTSSSYGNPVILWWKSDFPGTFETRHCSNNTCDVFNNVSNTDIHSVKAFLFYASNINFKDLPLPRRPRDIIWGLYHEESPRNVEELMHEDTLRLFNFSSTFSRHSDVPFPLLYLESKEDISTKKYFVPTYQKNMHLKEISPVMYLQTDCETTTERDAYVKELMNYIDIDSYGACLNNKKLPELYTKDYLNKLNDEAFLKFIARYKFVIAIENGVCYDYVTEKFWRAIKVGTVPIYFGSPSIRDWFPNKKSAILLEDYPTPKLMADHLKMLLNNDTLYEEYVEHKTKGVITNHRITDELTARDYQVDPLKGVETFECFICEKLHSIREGKAVTGSVVDRNHYNCPKPISALTLNVNPHNSWVYSWTAAKKKAKELYEMVMAT